jgi:hypothetical protein
MNVRGLMSLAQLAEHVGVDLWHFESPDGRSIRKALDYLLPFAREERAWPYHQPDSPSLRNLAPLVRTATAKFPDARYREPALKLPAVSADDRSNLLRPKSAVEGRPEQ